MDMGKNAADALRAHTQELAHSWATRIQASIERYRRRPISEIEGIAAEFITALAEALAVGSHEGLEDWARKTARLRAAMGFEAAELERAMLMGCEVLYPAFEEAFGGDAQGLVWAVTQTSKAIQRCANLVNAYFHELGAARLHTELSEAVAASVAWQRRLEAAAEALGYGAVVVDAKLAVVWADQRTAEAHGAVLAPGSTHACSRRQHGGACPLAVAAERGETARAEPTPDCPVAIAIPIKPAEAEVAEVLGLIPR